MGKYYKNKNIVMRKVLPSYFMIDITKCYNNDREKMFVTDEIGALIWTTHKDGDAFEEIYDKFLEQLTDEKTEELKTEVKKDLQVYMGVLLKENYLIER